MLGANFLYGYQYSMDRYYVKLKSNHRVEIQLIIGSTDALPQELGPIKKELQATVEMIRKYEEQESVV